MRAKLEAVHRRVADDAFTKALRSEYDHYMLQMDRCHLKGERGDKLHAVLCAAGYNIRWLLRMIAKKGVTFLCRLYLRLCARAGVSPDWQHALGSLLARALSGPAQLIVGARI